MAAKQLSDGQPDGTVMGQNTSDVISFFGVTPVVQQATAAAGTDLATTQTLANQIRTNLRNLGLMA